MPGRGLRSQRGGGRLWALSRSGVPVAAAAVPGWVCPGIRVGVGLGCAGRAPVVRLAVCVCTGLARLAAARALAVPLSVCVCLGVRVCVGVCLCVSVSVSVCMSVSVCVGGGVRSVAGSVRACVGGLCMCLEGLDSQCKPPNCCMQTSLPPAPPAPTSGAAPSGQGRGPG